MQAQALRVVLVSILSIAAGGAVETQPLVPLGEEVVLPPPETCGHFDPRVAWTTDGGLLAVWDSGLPGIVARSSPIGGPLTNLELALADGRLAAAWQITQTVQIIPEPCSVGFTTVAQSFKTRADPTDVPALSELGLAVLALLLGAAALGYLARRRRRRRAKPRSGLFARPPRRTA